MRPQDYSELEDWPGYFGAVLGKGARETMVAALDSFAKEGFSAGFAFDLAAGEGRDTLELLKLIAPGLPETVLLEFGPPVDSRPFTISF